VAPDVNSTPVDAKTDVLFNSHDEAEGLGNGLRPPMPPEDALLSAPPLTATDVETMTSVLFDAQLDSGIRLPVVPAEAVLVADAVLLAT
jgi:hypothetical protein